MIEEKKYPKVVVGVFIFNDKNELFLMKVPRWQNQYCCPGGHIEYDESILDTVKREVKEETNMDLDNIEFLTVWDGRALGDSYLSTDKHLIILDYKAKVKNTDNIILNKEATKYHWLLPGQWTEKGNLEKFTKLTIDKYLIENNTWENKYKRALADYQNLLKQTSKEKEEFAKFANEQFLYQILPIYDNLKMAIIHSEKKENDSWHEGVKHVLMQFKNTLSDFGVEEIKTIREEFDHNMMEAVSSEPTEDESQDDIVAKEIKAGYRLNGKVIIPARVVVYKYSN